MARRGATSARGRERRARAWLRQATASAGSFLAGELSVPPPLYALGHDSLLLRLHLIVSSLFICRMDDADSSFTLEMRIVAPNCRGQWYELSKVVDADRINFKDFVDEVVETNPHGYGELVKVYYWALDTKVNIELCTDQDLLHMFEKHSVSKCCFVTFAYYKPSNGPPQIPLWDIGTTSKSVETPFTPSIGDPSLGEPSHSTHTQSDEPEILPNPHPMNEHVGVDDEVLYLDFGPSYQPQPPPNPKAYESSEDEICSDSDVSDESDDEMVSDRVPDGLPDLNYDKKNPPMAVGTLYSDMDAFKIALATHCAIGEHQYVIDKSDPGRYRVHCKFREELDCPWRIHASALKDGVTIKV